MATILTFEPKETGGKSADPATSRQEAEIVIFPGVRIERQEFRLSDRLVEPEPDNPGSRGRVRRTTSK